MRIVQQHLNTSVLLMIVVLVQIFYAPIVNAADAQLTLQQCYTLALKRSESLARQQQLIKEAEGLFLQSLSTALPQINYQFDITHSQGSKHKDLGRFTFSQPLFSGFKEFAAIAGGSALRKERELQVQRAKELLLIDVVDAYYLLWLYQQDQKVVEDIVGILNKQREELMSRVRLGRSRASSLAAIEAQIAKQQAIVTSIRTNSLVSQHLLEFLIGQAIDKPLESMRMPQATTRQLTDYEQMAINRADVKATQQAVKVSEREVTVSRSGFFPTVSFDGNYYTHKTSSTPQDWDVGLKFDVPLFQGGENFGKWRESKAKLAQSRLMLEENKRRAIMETRQAFDSWQGAFDRQQSLDNAFIASERSFKLQESDYQQNLISVLDYLGALTDLNDAKRDQMVAKSDALRAWWKLKVTSGDMSDVTF